MDEKMDFFKKTVLLCCLFLISQPFCGVEEEIGLNFTVPNGWSLSRSKRNSFYMDDTTALFRGRFWFVVYENILQKADSPKDWVIHRNLAYQIGLQSNECYGVLYASDTLQQDGLFAMYSNGEVGDCYMDVTYRQHYRFVANGNFGWDIGVETDSADMVSQYSLYLAFLDSIKIKQDFSEIIYKTATHVHTTAGYSNPMRLTLSPEGIVELQNPDGPEALTEWLLELYGLDGRRHRTLSLNRFPYILDTKEINSSQSLFLLRPRFNSNRSDGDLAPFIFRIQ
jgi:hypothetical protein